MTIKEEIQHLQQKSVTGKEKVKIDAQIYALKMKLEAKNNNNPGLVNYS